MSQNMETVKNEKQRVSAVQTAEKKDGIQCINKKIMNSILEMLINIDDLKKLERIHRFIEYVYVSK